eukprot:scaffold3811_cov148-Skeletonema_menzelii.AAC.7
MMATTNCAVRAGPSKMMVTTGICRLCVIILMIISFFVLSTAFNLPFTSLNLRGTSPHNSYIFPLHSAPAKGPESHGLDAIQDEFIQEQLPQVNINSYTNDRKRSRRKRQQTSADNNGSKVRTAVKKNQRRQQRGSKSSTPTSSMPPWLSQYENDNLMGSNQHLLEDTESPSLSLTSYTDPRKIFDSGTQNTVTPMQRIQSAMSGIFYHSDAEPALLSPHAISHFTQSEINDVLDSIRVASHSNSKLMDGCADFLYMMLTLEEEGKLTSDFLSNERWDDDNIDDVVDEWSETNRKIPPEGKQTQHSIMTRDVLIAASFHYCDCVRARKAGVYDYVRQAMGASAGASSDQKRQELLLPSASPEKNTERRRGKSSHNETQVEFDVDVSRSAKSTAITTITRRGKASIERYGKESANIAAGAARLKRAEIMASVIRSKPKASDAEAETLRSFLVSLSEDWRGLVIRSAACLYRLKGISEIPESSGKVVLSTTTLRTARDALRVYAPLAQRLGMQRLKSELENAAFRILYRRQHSVASSLYGNDVDEMKAIVQVLTSRIEQLLRSDPIFLEQIVDVTVSSRIKEPYSLWKKMLRIRKQIADSKRDEASTTNDPIDSNVSIRWIPDAIALRVVLRASKLSLREDEDSVRTREKMLCYYALQLISDVWPASTANKAKDYIQNPKGNGYQSLHYTAYLMINGDEWPFEVQIRSEEMHRIAEFGVAAHWDYKLETKSAALPGESSSPATSMPILALPALKDTRPEMTTARDFDTEQELTESQRKGRIESYIDALTTSRASIVTTNLFIFISSTESALDGHLISIDPSIASVADVLKKCGVDSDVASGKMFLNGVKVTLDQELCNGDVLTLPASLVNKLEIK